MARRKTNTTGAKNIICKWDNIFSFVDYCDNAQVNSIFKNEVLGSQRDGGSWAGSESWEQAHDLLKNGDADSMGKVNEYFVKFTKQATATAPRFRAAVAGAVPIVPAYLAGSPKSMLARQQAKTRAKVLTVVYNVCADSGQDADVLARTGAKFLAAVNAIEKSGCRLNIYMAVCAERDREKVTFAVRVKTDGQKLNLIQIAYPLVNPSFLRRHFFKVIETNKEITSEYWPGSYGYPVHGKYGENAITAAGMKFDAYLDYYEAKNMDTAAIIKKLTAGK